MSSSFRKIDLVSGKGSTFFLHTVQGGSSDIYVPAEAWCTLCNRIGTRGSSIRHT